MSRYTPGPWHVEEEEGTYGVFSNDDLLALILPGDLKQRFSHSFKRHSNIRF